MKRLTIKDFLEKATNIHGSRYDYSKSVYSTSANKLTVICKQHGEFPITPSNHYAGKGCPRCAGRLNGDTLEFVKMAKKVHGATYDYSLVEYVSCKSKIIIKCKMHGEFEQTPQHHLAGTRCPHCFGTVKLTTEEFIIRAKQIHGDKFNYSKTVYISANKSLEIICKEHGSFWQTYGNHVDKKQGCPKCYGNFPRTTEEFIRESTEIHSGKYGYCKSEYKNLKSKVTIICSVHGEFKQSAVTHLKGSGCKACVKYGYKVDKPATLYLFKINETILGFGITNDFKTRHNKHISTFKKHKAAHNLLQTFNCSGHQALAIENHLKQTYEIIDTGIEGFRKEATEIKHLPDILKYINKLLDTI